MKDTVHLFLGLQRPSKQGSGKKACIDILLKKMNKRILQKALNIAKLLENQKQTICAIVVDKKDRILSIGCNRYEKSHPVQYKYAKKTGNENKMFLHAEVEALIKIPYGKQPHAIYIARTGSKGEPRLAKPCPICDLAIKSRNINEVYYTKG